MAWRSGFQAEDFSWFMFVMSPCKCYTALRLPTMLTGLISDCLRQKRLKSNRLVCKIQKGLKAQIWMPGDNSTLLEEDGSSLHPSTERIQNWWKTESRSGTSESCALVCPSLSYFTHCDDWHPRTVCFSAILYRKQLIRLQAACCHFIGMNQILAGIKFDLKVFRVYACIWYSNEDTIASRCARLTLLWISNWCAKGQKLSNLGTSRFTS